MSETNKFEKKYNGDVRDISLVKRQAWLQNQVPWTRVIKKDKKWRKSRDRTFRPKYEINVEPDPYQFKSIPHDISDVLKTKRQNINLSIQNLAFKSNVNIDKIMNFENSNKEQNRTNNFLSNFELYKINYIIDNYHVVKDIKNVRIPLPEGKLSNLSAL